MTQEESTPTLAELADELSMIAREILAFDPPQRVADAHRKHRLEGIAIQMRSIASREILASAQDLVAKVEALDGNIDPEHPDFRLTENEIYGFNKCKAEVLKLLSEVREETKA